MEKGKHDRRGFVKKSAVTLSAVGSLGGAVGTAAGAGTPSLQSEGIEERFRALREAGQDRQIVRMLDGYGIPYAFTKKGVVQNGDDVTVVSASLHEGETIEEKARGHVNSGNASGDVGTYEEWDESASYFDRITTVSDSDPAYGLDYWYTDHYWDLAEGNATDGNAEIADPDDGVEISFSDEHWTHDNPEASAGDRTDFDSIGSRGLGALFDDPANNSISWDTDKVNSLVWTYLWRMDKAAPYTLYSHYAHTWSHVTGSIGIGYAAIPFTFSFGWDTDHWEVWINHQVHPDGTVEETRR